MRRSFRGGRVGSCGDGLVAVVSAARGGIGRTRRDEHRRSGDSCCDGSHRDSACCGSASIAHVRHLSREVEVESVVSRAADMGKDDGWPAVDEYDEFRRPTG